MKHLIFYDAPCPLCNRSIRVILKYDRKGQFYFAPLQGETAKKMLDPTPSLDSLILIENWRGKERLLTQAKAVFRIAWHLGGRFALLGWISFLPTALFDLMYKMVAKRRYRLFTKTVEIDPTKYQERFLP